MPAGGREFNWTSMCDAMPYWKVRLDIGAVPAFAPLVVFCMHTHQ
jgi:hypothetical protein